MKQITLKRNAEITGPGLHKGKINSVIISPAEADAGFLIRNAGEEYVLSPALVKDTKRGTTIKHKKSVLHTVEHMVSALRGLGVDNAVIEIKGGEPPAADGSSYPYVQAVKKAGLKTLP